MGGTHVTRDEITQKVYSIVASNFDMDEAEIVDTLNIKDDLDADSIAIMEFVLELEDTFDAEISDEDAETIETIGAAIDYIEQMQQNNA